MSEAEATESAEDSGIVTEGGNPLLEPEAEPNPLAALPEKFKSVEDLVTSYTNLESKIGAKEESFREQFLKEMEEQAYANRPASVGDYQLPEGIDESAAVDNELLQWWANQSFENGYSQEEFSQGIEMYMNALNADVPDYDAELAKLGDNASARTDAASLFANQFFPEEVLPAIERMCETSEGIIALEYIMEQMKEGGPSGSTQAAAQQTEADLRQMMLDPRYFDSSRRDPTFVKQVEEGWKRLYGS